MSDNNSLEHKRLWFAYDNLHDKVNSLEFRYKNLSIGHEVVRRRLDLVMDFLGAVSVDCEGNIAVQGWLNKFILCAKILFGGKK